MTVDGGMVTWFSWPAFAWLLFTLLVYALAAFAYQRSKGNLLLLPVLTSVIVVVTVLVLADISYADYASHTKVLTYLIGPATVALAVPLYRQLQRIKAQFLPLMAALSAGCVTAVASAVAIAWVFGGSREVQWSLAPKSATMPIAMDIAGLTGGVASLTAVGVALTGISATMLSTRVFRLVRIDDSFSQGFGLGMAAHAIGTARGLQISEIAGAAAALAMGLNAIATALLIPALQVLIAWVQALAFA
jgi:predicted murein hydrolase (TIGR00659 family)